MKCATSIIRSLQHLRIVSPISYSFHMIEFISKKFFQFVLMHIFEIMPQQRAVRGRIDGGTSGNKWYLMHFKCNHKERSPMLISKNSSGC